MRVHRWREEDGYLGLIAERGSDNVLLNQVCNGLSLREGWYPVEVRLNREFDKPRKKGKVGDLASNVSTCPILSRKAVEGLGMVLEKHGEVLPLSCAEGEYFVFNPLTVIDAIDFDKSSVRRLPSGAIWDMGNRYCFRPELLEDVWIFMVPQLSGSIFVTDAFVRLVAEGGLSGFRFSLAWDSEGQAH